ncbi:hypothetical protein GIB67_042116 [Kingdonia uniflora]|uniref:Pentatricopeptide repeat-containing protein n=1 Tax=Kingdonia uniflora TaxID=39325 RepID=A0A7J7NNQ7_9MAGN|nr:hypothetical protein GIB67_042116 [Kingdonia uniflora]
MLGENPKLPVFTIEKVAIAATNFTFDNKLEEDGFGLVYKFVVELWHKSVVTFLFGIHCGFEGVDCKGIRDQADDFMISRFDLWDSLVGQTVAYELQKLYRNMEFDKIYPDGQLLNDLIAASAKMRDPDRAMFFLVMVQGQGLSVKIEMLVVVVSALGNIGRIVESEAVFEEVKEGGLKPRIRAYNAFLKGYVNMGSLRDAESIVMDMERGEVLKLANCRDRGDWQKSFSVLREMRNSGDTLDRHFYNVMIGTFGKYNCL